MEDRNYIIEGVSEKNDGSMMLMVRRPNNPDVLFAFDNVKFISSEDGKLSLEYDLSLSVPPDLTSGDNRATIADGDKLLKEIVADFARSVDSQNGIEDK